MLAAPNASATPPRIDPARLPSGVALPYPTRRVFRGFGHCLGHGRHRHEALDLGGVGPNAGLGTPVRSMVRARIVRIGSPATQPLDFGSPYRGARVVRGGRELPSGKVIPGYGQVWFFTARRGKWRSGTLIETIGLEAPLQGHRIRYMHLAAVRPDLEAGDVIEAGEELGLLGGTGVQRASPHVHIDVRTADDRPVDVAPLLGLAPTASCGEVRAHADKIAGDFVDASATGPSPPERWPAGPAEDPRAPIELDPPPRPWNAPTSALPSGVVPRKIDIADCGVFEHVASGPADLRTRLHARRWLELTLTAGKDQAPAIELWDVERGARLTPGQTTPIALTELQAPGRPARLQLVLVETTDIALVVRGEVPWQLTIREKCKRASPPAPP